MRLHSKLVISAMCAVTIACSKESRSPTEPTTGGTIIQGFVQTATIVVDNPPCVLNGSTPSCMFRAVASRQSAQTMYSYTWRFTNPANGRGVQISPAYLANPPMNCVFLPDAGTTNIEVRVTATIGSDVWEIGTSTVPITRPPGQC
jgi:hypothetical protein